MLHHVHRPERTVRMSLRCRVGSYDPGAGYWSAFGRAGGRRLVRTLVTYTSEIRNIPLRYGANRFNIGVFLHCLS